jgi:hypothetical protein
VLPMTFPCGIDGLIYGQFRQSTDSHCSIWHGNNLASFIGADSPAHSIDKLVFFKHQCICPSIIPISIRRHKWNLECSATALPTIAIPVQVPPLQLSKQVSGTGIYLISSFTYIRFIVWDGVWIIIEVMEDVTSLNKQIGILTAK